MDKKIITFDLETIADKSVIPIIDSILPIKPNGTLKNLIKIKADIEKKEKERLKMLGVNPMTAMICCFGWHDGKKSIILCWLMNQKKLKKN